MQFLSSVAAVALAVSLCNCSRPLAQLEFVPGCALYTACLVATLDQANCKGRVLPHGGCQLEVRQHAWSPAKGI